MFRKTYEKSGKISMYSWFNIFNYNYRWLISDNIIIFKYFFEKNKSPNYIKDFYLSYIIIKFCDLGIEILYIMYFLASLSSMIICTTKFFVGQN